MDHHVNLMRRLLIIFFKKKKIIVLSVARGFAAGCVRKPGNNIGDGGCVRKFGVRVARADAASFSRNPYLRLLLFGKKKVAQCDHFDAGVAFVNSKKG